MTELARQLLAYLERHGRGAENRQRRRHLARVLGCSDRALRKAIEELRALGYPVVGDPQRGGYFLAATRGEAEAAIAILKSYMMSHLRQIRMLEKRFGIDAQLSLPLEA